MRALTLILEEQIGQQVGSLEKNDISSDILQNSLCVQSENRHRLLNVKYMYRFSAGLWHPVIFRHNDTLSQAFLYLFEHNTGYILDKITHYLPVSLWQYHEWKPHRSQTWRGSSAGQGHEWSPPQFSNEKKISEKINEWINWLIIVLC